MKASNQPIAALAAGFLCATAVATAQEGTATAPEVFEPKPYRIDSFDEIWSKSPFAFEILVEEEAEEGQVEDLALMGFSQKGDVYYATIFNQKDAKGPRIMVNSLGPNEDGYRLVRVERGGTYKDTKVLLEKGEDTDFISYDTKRLATQPTGAVGGAPSRPANQGGNPNPGANPGNANAPGDPNAPQPGRTANPAAAATNNSEQSRNEVIQRLLERARQNREGANANANGNGNAQPAESQRRRRVVLPPSNNR